MGGRGFTGPTSAVGISIVSIRSSVIDSTGR
jgi:hypothetical protein